MKAFLDTHAAVALWRGDVSVFGSASKEILESALLFISPVVLLELAFLNEIGRLSVASEEIVGTLALECRVEIAKDPIHAVIERSMELHWTRDPFDRLLVATALLHRCQLITRDRLIRQHFDGAVW